MTWFEQLVGFPEQSPAYVRENLRLEGERLTSLVNQKQFRCGRLETPSLAELRSRVRLVEPIPGKLTIREQVANVADLHSEPGNANTLFQVASQFNLLEMVNPQVTPEKGVGIYQYDRTQGPICAMAAGAGTIYRNYFVEVNGQIGQSAHNQIDCLADLGQVLGNNDNRLWQMSNGYALASYDGLVEIAERLRNASESDLDQLRPLLRVGIQWQTQVTRQEASHNVSQIYCSALPIAYSPHPPALWEPFARLVLEAAYEATLCTAILNWQMSGRNRVFLTLLGGGAFGNKTAWILDSLNRAVQLYQQWGLELLIVSYGGSNPSVRELVKQFL